MKSLTLKIAGLNLRLELLDDKWFDYFRKKYANFLTNNSIRSDFKAIVEFLDSTRIKDIRFEFIDEKTTKIVFPSSFKHFGLLNFAVKNSFAACLLRNKGCLIHASSVVIENKAVLFAGVSGQGKSTIARQFRRRLADDRSIVRFIGKRPFVFGSPFYEQHDFAKIRSKFPLGGIFLLKKKEIEKIEILKLSPSIALFKLLPHMVIREEELSAGRRKQFKRALRMCRILASSIPVYTISRPLSVTGPVLERSIYDHLV